MITITIDTSKEAFQVEFPQEEVSRILWRLADNIASEDLREWPVVDYSGNVVGKMTVEEGGR